MVKKVIILIVIFLLAWLGYAAYERGVQRDLLKKLINGSPDPSAALVSKIVTANGYTYNFDFYSDAEDVTKTSISTASTDVMYARPGTTTSSYSISFHTKNVSNICTQTGAQNPRELRRVTLSSGVYPICTTSKRAIMLMNFKDTNGVWHSAILLNPSLSIPDSADSDIVKIFSSIKVD